jgi:outer membrane protein
MKKNLSYQPALTLIISLFLFAPLKAQDFLTIEDAISIGLENNYGVQISRNLLEQAENNHSIGNAGFLPVLDLTSSHSERVEDSEFEAGGNRQTTTGARSSNTNAALNFELDSV